MEKNTQEQTEHQENQQAQEQVEQTPQASALEERLAKMEGAISEQKGYITKLEQENSTYRQIISDRGQAAPAQAINQQATVSELDKEIEALEKQAEAGEITPEELSIRSLKLIRKAKEAGKQEAVREVSTMYSQEQEITRRFNSIFEDPDLKGLEKDFSDIAFGYLQAGIAQGKTLQQAAEYAKTQTKEKINKFRERFGISKKKEEEESVESQTPASSANPLKGEGESNKQPEKKEEPVTAESGQTNFIERRRAKMMR